MGRCICLALPLVCLGLFGGGTSGRAASIYVQGMPGLAVGADGGNAVADVVSSDPSNDATAAAGDGEFGISGPGGRGGDGLASASLTTAGTTSANLIASGGDGGGAEGQSTLGGSGGNGYTTASVTSSNGASVTLVSARGNGGSAPSPFVTSPQPPGPPVTGGNGGNGGVAATVHDTGSASVSLTARVFAGNGGWGAIPGAPGLLSIGPLDAVSDGGGSVRVSLDATGGASGVFLQGGDAVNGDGGDVALLNAVSGETSGSLSLAQHAFGGAGRAAAANAGAPARGGNASSILDGPFHSQSVLIDLGATGGAAPGDPVVGALGGSSAVSSDVTNDAGDITAKGVATGGMGGGTGRGGDARAEVRATVESQPGTASANATAIGGDEDTYASPLSLEKAGVGGNADSLAIANSSGAASAVAFGRGGGSDNFNSGAQDRGDGGSARAEALATAHGDGAATADAQAYGGANGGALGGLVPGAGGGAYASARATSDSADALAKVIVKGGAVGPGRRRERSARHRRGSRECRHGSDARKSHA